MQSNNDKLRLKIYTVIFLAVIILGPIGFMMTEGLSPVDALYFTVVTIATVGYGDISPVTPAGKALTVILIVAGVGTFVGVVANATEVFLNRREEKAKNRKLHMLIGLFFSEAGTRLLGALAKSDRQHEALAEELVLNDDWDDARFAHARLAIRKYSFEVDPGRVDLEHLRDLLNRHGGLFVQLMENPYILEHELFTDLLVAILHLKEELVHRDDISALPESDLQHLAGDMARAHVLLVDQWLAYTAHLKDHYPFLYSLALRTNPFDNNASAVVKG